MLANSITVILLLFFMLEQVPIFIAWAPKSMCTDVYIFHRILFCCVHLNYHLFSCPLAVSHTSPPVLFQISILSTSSFKIHNRTQCDNTTGWRFASFHRGPNKIPGASANSHPRPGVLTSLKFNAPSNPNGSFNSFLQGPPKGQTEKK